MGFLDQLGDAIGRKLVSERAFNAGKNGEARPTYPDTAEGRRAQALSDQAYEDGRTSLLVRTGKKVADD